MSAVGSVGGQGSVHGLLGLGTPGSAVGGQAGVADLVKQGAITDVQSAGCLFAIPVVMLQDFQDDLAFQFPDCLPGDFLQRNRAVYRNVGAEEVLLMRPQ